MLRCSLILLKAKNNTRTPKSKVDDSATHCDLYLFNFIEQ